MGAQGLTIPTRFSAIDKFSPVLKGMGRAVTSFAEKSEADIARLERQMKKLSNSSKEIAMKTGIAGAAILAPLALAVEAADNFQAKMANVSTLVDTTKESMAEMGQKVLDVATRVPVAIDDLTASLYQIRSAGVPAAKAMEVLEVSARLSVAGLSTAKEATDAMTSAINVFKDENLSAAAISDIFFKTVKAGKTTMAELSEAFGSTAPIVNAAGVKFADFQAATAALTLTGLKAAEAQHEVNASVLALIKPTKQMEQVFHRLGVKSGKELISKMGSVGAAFKAVEDAGTKAGVNMAKAWGRKEAFTAVTLLNGSQSAAYVSNLKEMATGANAVDEAFKKQMETSAAQAQLAKNNAAAFSITIGTLLLPIIDKIIQKVVPMIRGLKEWIDKHSELATGIAITTGAIGLFLLVVSAVSGIISIVTGATWLLTVAQKAAAIWQDALTVAQIAGAVAATAWGVAMDIGLLPILAIIAAIGVLVVAIIMIVKHVKGWGAQWQEITRFMSAVFSVFKYGLILDFLFIKEAFASMVDAVVLAWEWGQNKMGLLSDAQYAKNKAQIKAEQTARINAIEDAAKKGAAAAKVVSQGMDFKLSWQSDPAASGSNPAINPKKAEQDALITKMQTTNNNKTTTVDFKNVPNGVQISGENTGGSITPRLGSTSGGW